jgi:hypothetical protein
LRHLGDTISGQTVRNILKRHGMSPAPERKETTTWNAFIRTPMDMLVAADFFTAEVWTACGLVTYHVLLFIHLASRKIHVAGMTPYPDQCWMAQMACDVTIADWVFLQPGQYLIHDRDGKFCPVFQRIIDKVGVQRVVLLPRSPNLHAYAERWVKSVKDEVLSWLILFSEHSLRHALTQYEDVDAHVYIHPPRDMPAENIERLELTIGERCNELLLETGLFIGQCGVRMMAMKSNGHCMGVENGSTGFRTTLTAGLFEYFDYTT